jgi:hypothetical protein
LTPPAKSRAESTSRAPQSQRRPRRLTNSALQLSSDISPLFVMIELPSNGRLFFAVGYLIGGRCARSASTTNKII